MNSIKFNNIDEVIECYGRYNLVPIENLQQVLFYVKHGCQPKFVYEHENKPGKITFWFVKNETSYIY